MTKVKEQDFQKAEMFWDVERLLDDLAKVNNGKALTPTEQLTLRGLLCGHTPKDLAEIRSKDKKGQQANVSKGLHRYVKDLMKEQGFKVPERMNSTEMLDVLKKAGYKKQLIASKDERTLPIKALEGLFMVIGNEVSSENNKIKNEITVEINIRLVTSLPVDEINKMLTDSEDLKE